MRMTGYRLAKHGFYFLEAAGGSCYIVSHLVKTSSGTDPGSCPIVKAVSTVTGLEWPRGFQEVKVPRFHDNGTGWW
jgi:hypothetical protein